MKEIDYIIPIVVSGIFALLLLVFYFYESGNNAVMRFFSAIFMKTRYSRAKIQKDTRKQDNIMLGILIILILAFGLKSLSFAVVISDSMKPEFQRGDLVFTQSVSKEPQKGDIITFKAIGVQNPVTHRVVSVKGDVVTTKGDNNPMADDYGITKRDIISKAIVINNHPVVIPGVGSYFILDFSKEGKLYKYGDQFAFLQQMFVVIRTWGYVITIISFTALIMSMLGKK